MSTNGSFTPSAAPECAYEPEMTRADALARRTAGTLDPNCVVVITDGPVIGTAGNTSSTQIELQPVTPTDLGRAALVHTTFDNVAFIGNYNIDDGPNGSLNALTDHWNNTVRDEDAGAPTVHTQFPYHLSGPTLRDNVVDDCVLTGWAALPNPDIRDNNLSESTVDLTGATTLARLVDNTVHRSVLTSHALQTVIESNTLTATTVTHLGTGSPGFGCTQNTFTGGEFIADAATTAQLTLSDNVVGGTDNGYRIHVTGKTGAAVAIQGNRMSGRSTAAQELTCQGTGEITVEANDVSAGVISLNGSGDSVVSSSTLAGATLTKAAGSSGPLTVTGNQFTNATLTVGAANAAVDNAVSNSVIRGGTFNLLGPVAGGGRNDLVATTVLDLTVNVAATATAGVRLDGGVYNRGVVNQNRTAGTGSLSLLDCATLGALSSVTDNGTVDPGGFAVELQRVSLTDTAVSVGNLDAGRTLAPVLAYVDALHSAVNMTGLPGGFIGDGRMLFSTLTNAGFELHTFTMDGATKTLTASQSGRAASVAFDNFT